MINIESSKDISFRFFNDVPINIPGYAASISEAEKAMVYRKSRISLYKQGDLQTEMDIIANNGLPFPFSEDCDFEELLKVKDKPYSEERRQEILENKTVYDTVSRFLLQVKQKSASDIVLKKKQEVINENYGSC